MKNCVTCPKCKSQLKIFDIIKDTVDEYGHLYADFNPEKELLTTACPGADCNTVLTFKVQLSAKEIEVFKYHGYED